MVTSRSRLTAEGRTTVPAAIRRRLGLAPGATLEWFQEGEKILVRRVGRFTSAELHEALFSGPVRRRSLGELKAGLKAHVKQRHTRR